jgi:hypothetical protein
MNGGSNKATTGKAGGALPTIKERVFSIIRKLENEGITDGRRRLWIDFTPHIVIEQREDGYVVWLWRDCVVVKITLDNEFNITGFDVERP